MADDDSLMVAVKELAGEVEKIEKILKSLNSINTGAIITPGDGGKSVNLTLKTSLIGITGVNVGLVQQKIIRIEEKLSEIGGGA